MRVRRRCVHDGLVAWAQVRVPALLLLRPWCRVGRRRLRRTRHRGAPLPVHARLCRPPRRISAHLPRGDHACLAPRRHWRDAVRRHPHAPRLRDVLQPARRGAAAQPLDHAPPVYERRILCAGRVREIARDRLHGPPRAARPPGMRQTSPHSFPRERLLIAPGRSTWCRTCHRKRAPQSTTPASSQPRTSHPPRGRAHLPIRGTHSPSRAPRFAVASPPPQSTSPSGTARSATPEYMSSVALAACEPTEATRCWRRRSHPFERWCTDSERGTRRATSRRAATNAPGKIQLFLRWSTWRLYTTMVVDSRPWRSVAVRRPRRQWQCGAL